MDCVLYAISLRGRCLKFVMLNYGLFMDRGLSVDEVEEICFGQTFLKKA